jgi:hypothetical protein
MGHREAQRRYARSDQGKLVHREAQRRYSRRNPAMESAHTTVGRAIAKGTLTRPDVCQQCFGSGPIEAHHYLGYAKEHRLDVAWLCDPCHKEVHLD